MPLWEFKFCRGLRGGPAPSGAFVSAKFLYYASGRAFAPEKFLDPAPSGSFASTNFLVTAPGGVQPRQSF